jgi:hypothetical protein
MSLSDLASLGSFVSAVAVAVTLIFTLFQLRQNNLALRAATQQNRTARYTEQILRPTEPFLCEAVTKAAEGRVDLTSEQVMAFTRHSASVFWNSEDVFLQHQGGNLDQEAFESDTAILKGFLTNPAYRVGWRINRPFASGAFQDYIEALIREVKPSRPPVYTEIWKGLLAQEMGAIEGQ